MVDSATTGQQSRVAKFPANPGNQKNTQERLLISQEITNKDSRSLVVEATFQDGQPMRLALPGTVQWDHIEVVENTDNNTLTVRFSEGSNPTKIKVLFKDSSDTFLVEKETISKLGNLFKAKLSERWENSVDLDQTDLREWLNKEEFFQLTSQPIDHLNGAISKDNVIRLLKFAHYAANTQLKKACENWLRNYAFCGNQTFEVIKFKKLLTEYVEDVLRLSDQDLKTESSQNSSAATKKQKNSLLSQLLFLAYPTATLDELNLAFMTSIAPKNIELPTRKYFKDQEVALLTIIDNIPDKSCSEILSFIKEVYNNLYIQTIWQNFETNLLEKYMQAALNDNESGLLTIFFSSIGRIVGTDNLKKTVQASSTSIPIDQVITTLEEQATMRSRG